MLLILWDLVDPLYFFFFSPQGLWQTAGTRCDVIPEPHGLVNRHFWFRDYELPSGVNLLQKLGELL
jgi:hypothetical protein